MKALSIKQPWIGLTVLGLKPIETRTWYTPYRGPLLLCSSKTRDENAMEGFVYTIGAAAAGRSSFGPGRGAEFISLLQCRLQGKGTFDALGMALAVADLVDCRPMTEADEKAAHCPVYDGAYSWVFENIRPIKPFPVRGALGIFEVDYLPNKEEGMNKDRTPKDKGKRMKDEGKKKGKPAKFAGKKAKPAKPIAELEAKIRALESWAMEVKANYFAFRGAESARKEASDDAKDAKEKLEEALGRDPHQGALKLEGDAKDAKGEDAKSDAPPDTAAAHCCRKCGALLPTCNACGSYIDIYESGGKPDPAKGDADCVCCRGTGFMPCNKIIETIKEGDKVVHKLCGDTSHWPQTKRGNGKDRPETLPLKEDGSGKVHPRRNAADKAAPGGEVAV